MFDVKDGIQISKSVVINKDKDVFAKKVTASGGAVINTGSWNKDGLRLNGAAPSIYFSQDDGSNAYLGLNGGNFYVLPDTDSNGTYSSPYILQASFSGNDFRYFGHKVYHAGNKPYFSEIIGTIDNGQLPNDITVGGNLAGYNVYAGKVGLTTNDGHGNANVTFNHRNGRPVQNGNSLRIETNVDGTSNPVFVFEAAANVTAGEAIVLSNIATLGLSEFTYKGNAVYHAGRKPTYGELGTIYHGNVDFANQYLNTGSSPTFLNGTFTGELKVENAQPWLRLNDTTGNNARIRNQSNVIYIDADNGTGNGILQIGSLRTDGILLGDTSGPYLYRSDVAKNHFSLRVGNSGAYKYLTFKGDDGTLELGGQRVLTVGSGKAVDSDKLDGVNSSQFLRSDVSNTLSANLHVTGSISFPVGDSFVGVDQEENYLRYRFGSTATAKGVRIDDYDTPVIELNRDIASDFKRGLKVSGNAVYHRGDKQDYIPTLGNQALMPTGRNALAEGIHTYGTKNNTTNTPHASKYGESIVWGSGAAGSVEVWGGWVGAGWGRLYTRALRNVTDDWSDWYEIYTSRDGVPFDKITGRTLAHMNAREGYWGLNSSTDGSNGSWIRTPSAGLLPYQSGVSSSLGASSWKFDNLHVKNGYMDNATVTGSVNAGSGNFGSLKAKNDNTNTLIIDKSSSSVYSGLQYATGGKASWLWYTSNNGTEDFSLQTRNFNTDGQYRDTVFSIDHSNAQMRFMRTGRFDESLRVDGWVLSDRVRNISGTGMYIYGGDMSSQHDAIQSKYGEGELIYLAAEGGVQILSSGDNLNNNGQAADTLTNDRRVVLCDSGGNSRFYQGTVTVDQIHAGNGQIAPSAAKLQVKGIQRTGTLYLHEGDNPGPNTEVILSSQAGGTRLRVATKDGYIDVGPQNSSYAHLTTNLDRFYFNKEIQVNGDIKVYNKLSKFTADGKNLIVGADSNYFSRFTDAGKISRKNSGWDNNSAEVDIFKSAWMSHLGDHILIRPTGNQVNNGVIAIGREAVAIGRNSYNDPAPNSWFDVFDVDTWMSLTASSLRFQGKEAFRYDDSYLRINKGKMFSSGVHFDDSAVVTTGDMHARLFRSSYATGGAIPDGADIAYRVNNTNDNYIRFATRNNVAAWLAGDDHFVLKSTTASNSLGDSAWIAGYADANNRDHIWHDEGSNTWHFVSDSPFKAAGNSTIRSGGVISSGLSKFTGRVMFGGDGNHNGQNANLAISVGDADTGIRWNSDGNMDLMANSVAALNVTNTRVRASIDIETAAKVRSTNYDVYTGEGRGIRFWNGSDSYKIYMSGHAGSDAGRIDPSSDYNMYFKMTSGNRGFVFKNNTNNFVHLTPAKSYFKGRMEIKDSANDLEPALLVQKRADVGNGGAALLVATYGETTDIILEGRANATGTATDVTGRASTSTSGDMKFQIWASGNANFKGNVTAYGSASDITLKENIKPITNAVDKTLKLNGCTFNYIERPDDILAGVIAQDVQKVMPELVYRTPDNKLAVRYGNMAGLFVEAIKELKTENDRLKSTLDDVLARLAALEGK
ncbi:tail fiber domain-containing protein [Alteromonas phage vB_AmaP_AD45-P1]|uniref:tail fiber domain-containing protein n=1 Tax=Alteromonas phage vB_AmaP_AD45-P1 TaxID=1300004 RepID=UPI0003334CD6|nr:tail fiber domain-containing protein [Alteromonas phage vB_AmaP_AD45-P1]AGM46838.1 hypothetical protein AD45P1_00100 [Alteromonas phage vB_AmaP_AD45-P1]AGM47074.1 hypothetical protein AD45P4_00095 [Alteromonas phage vB_AmaP_AD45-P4]